MSVSTMCAMAAMILMQLPASNIGDKFPAVSEGSKTIVSENIYRYTVLRYSPPVTITQLEKPLKCSQGSPEETVIAMVSAMSSLDYDLWSTCWKSAYQPKGDASTRKEMLSAWRRVVVGKSLILKHRIETGRYVLIEYLLQPTDKNVESSPNQTVTSTITLEKTVDKWLATNELAADPVRLFWQKPEYRQQVIVR